MNSTSIDETLKALEYFKSRDITLRKLLKAENVDECGRVAVAYELEVISAAYKALESKLEREILNCGYCDKGREDGAYYCSLCGRSLKK